MTVPIVTSIASTGVVLGSLTGELVRAAALAATTVVVAAVAVGRLVQRLLARRRLSDRVVFEVVPGEDFDPSLEDLRRFAARLEETRPATWRWAPRASRAVRIWLSADGADGLLRYFLQAHSSAVVFPPYAGVELRRIDAGQVPTARGRATVGERVARSSGSEAPGDRVTREQRVARVARAEYVLAGDPAWPLRLVPLRPDPLQALAAAVTDIRPGERIDVCLDLLPLTRAKVAYLARRRVHLPRASRASVLSPAAFEDGARRVWSMANGQYATATVPGLSARSGQRGHVSGRLAGQPGQRGQGGTAKLTGAEPTFAGQLLVRASAPTQDRATRHLRAVHGVLDGWAGEYNRWRVAGSNVGIAHLDGADSRWRRRGFDRRWRTGAFAPRGTIWLTAGEIAGVLKPATRYCLLRNVHRLAGVFPPPPRDLPTWTPDTSDLLPLGYVTGTDGTERLVGAPLEETTFSLRAGKSGAGKTELALVQAVALARAGHGIWFLDPHRDGWERARPYLCDDQVAARVWEIDLTVRSSTALQCGWNPLSMQGRGRDEIPAVAGAVTTGLMAASGWGESANRARTILVKATETLCELALQLPADAQPTVFQIRTLLHDPDWREAVVRRVSPDLQAYWETSFPSYASGAAAVVTNTIDTLASSIATRALLGQSSSTYDARRAMDTGRVVFLCPAGTGPTDRLVTCLLVFDLFRAAASRLTVPVEQRRLVHAFVDELTAVDGAAKGTIAAIVEQLRKYGVRAHFMTQMASRLTPTTRSAVMQNASILATSASEIDAAQAITRQWAHHRVTPSSVVALPAHHHAISVTLARQATAPFLIRGPHLGHDIFTNQATPERLPALDAAVTGNLARRPIADVLADLDELDDRIHTHLTGQRPDFPRESSTTTGQTSVRGTGHGVDLHTDEPTDAAEWS